MSFREGKQAKSQKLRKYFVRLNAENCSFAAVGINIRLKIDGNIFTGELFNATPVNSPLKAFIGYSE